MTEQNNLPLENEETLEEAGAFIVKNANDKLDDLWEETEETEEVAVQDEAGNDIDLSVFDEIDKVDNPVLPESTTNEQEPTPEFKKFADDFQKHIGFDIKDAISAVTELQNLRKELYVSKQEAQIRTAWGVDDNTFNERMSAVREYAQKVAKKNPELFAKLDNPEGVQLIWSKLDKGQKQQTQVPGIQQTSSRTPQNVKSSYDYTNSQIQKMNKQEYEANAKAIFKAYASGRVDMSK